MSLIRKDSLGQDVNIGDVVVWGNSSRYSGTCIGVVYKYTPKKIQTSSGQVEANNVVVITKQLEATQPQRLKKMVGDVKSKFEPIVAVVKKPVITYRMHISFIGENIPPANGIRNYSQFKLHIKLEHDGETIKPIQDPTTPQHMFTHKYYVYRDYEVIDSTSYYPRYKKNGKLVLADSYGSRNQKDAILTRKLVENVLGYLPTDTVTLDFNSIGELIDVFSDEMRINTKEKYGGGRLNTLGELLK